MKYLGAMIKQLRKEAHLNQSELGRGISSPPEISRIEHGEKEPDSFLLNALVQRLGKSLEQFEITVSGNEYGLELLRTQIRRAMLRREFVMAELYLEQYEKYPEYEKTLHKQYCFLLRAAINYMKCNEDTDCVGMLREAAALSISAIQEIVDTRSGLCLQELQLLLLYSFVCVETGEAGKVHRLLEQLAAYIEEGRVSEAIKGKVYPGCCYVLAKMYQTQGKMEQAYEAGEKGRRFLYETGSLLFLREILQLIKECHREEQAEEQLEALLYLNTYAEYQETEDMVLKLLFFGSCRNLVSGGELLKEARAAHGWSQEKLSAGVCARETISNIENGRTPNVKNLQKLLERLGIKHSKYFCYVTAGDFETYELVQQYKKSLLWQEREKAGVLYEELKRRLDVSVPLNWQFLQSMENIYKYQQGELTLDETIDRLERGIRYTMPEFQGSVQRIPYEEELIILNYIALCRWRKGETETALAIFESVRKSYLGN